MIYESLLLKYYYKRAIFLLSLDGDQTRVLLLRHTLAHSAVKPPSGIAQVNSV